MILTGSEIRAQRAAGSLVIDPFDERLVNPNSYNYRLGTSIFEGRHRLLDPRDANSSEWISRTIPTEGIVLEPRRTYLGVTMERIGSHEFVPLLIGRSSIGRLGLFLQISADLGQLGAIHQWTLELVATQPVRVYAGMRIGQVSFWEPRGTAFPYDGYFGFKSSPTTTPEGYNVNDSYRI